MRYHRYVHPSWHRAGLIAFLLCAGVGLTACPGRRGKEVPANPAVREQPDEERSAWPSLCASVCERADQCRAEELADDASGERASDQGKDHDRDPAATATADLAAPDDTASSTSAADDDDVRSALWGVIDCTQDCGEVTLSAAGWQVLAACDGAATCDGWLECVEGDYRKRSATLMAVPGASEACEAFCRQSVLCGAAVEAELRNDEYVEILSRTYGARVECVESCELERNLHGDSAIQSCVDTKTCATFERCAEKL